MLNTKNNNLAVCLASLSLSVAAPAAQPGSGADQKATPHPQTDTLLEGAAPGQKQSLTPAARIENAVEKIRDLTLQAQLDKNLMNEPLIEAQRKEIAAAVAEIVKPGVENHEANGAALRAAGLDSRDDLYNLARIIADIEINKIAKGIELDIKELQSPEGWRPRLLSTEPAKEPQIVNALQVGQGIEALIQDKKKIDPKAVADFLRALPERFKPMDADTSPVGPADSPEEKARLDRLRDNALRDNARQFETMRRDIDRRLDGLDKRDARERNKQAKKGIHVEVDPRSRAEILLETATAEDRNVIAPYLVSRAGRH